MKIRTKAILGIATLLFTSLGVAGTAQAKPETDCYIEHENRHGVINITDTIKFFGDIVILPIPEPTRLEMILNYRKCFHYRPNKPTTYDPVSLHIFGARTDHHTFNCRQAFFGFGFNKLKITMILTDRRPEIDSFYGELGCRPGLHTLLGAWQFHGEDNLLRLHRSHNDPPIFYMNMQPDISGLPDNHPLQLEGWLMGPEG